MDSTLLLRQGLETFWAPVATELTQPVNLAAILNKSQKIKMMLLMFV